TSESTRPATATTSPWPLDQLTPGEAHTAASARYRTACAGLRMQQWFALSLMRSTGFAFTGRAQRFPPEQLHLTRQLGISEPVDGTKSAAHLGGRVGGAVIAVRTADLRMLGGRDDVAVLWDIRVAPGLRGAGVGSALFRAAAGWAGARGCGWLKIETQNVNTAACRFYQKMGCTLGAIDRFAYPELPGEVQLPWWKALRAGSESASS